MGSFLLLHPRSNLRVGQTSQVPRIVTHLPLTRIDRRGVGVDEGKGDRSVGGGSGRRGLAGSAGGAGSAAGSIGVVEGTAKGVLIRGFFACRLYMVIVYILCERFR